MVLVLVIIKKIKRKIIDRRKYAEAKFSKILGIKSVNFFYPDNKLDTVILGNS